MSNQNAPIGLWASFETECMSRELSHEQYVSESKRLNVVAANLSKKQYEAIDKILFGDIKERQNVSDLIG